MSRLFTAFALWVALIATASDRGVLSLTVTAPLPKVRVGSNIVVQVATTNESNRVISYHNKNLCDYSVTVRTKMGTSAPETRFKKQLNCGDGQLRVTGRNILVTLKPGESKSEDISITEMYDMSANGEYTVQVERTFPDIGHFTSNIAKVEVTK